MKLRVRSDFQQHRLLAQQNLNGESACACIDRIDDSGDVAEAAGDDFHGGEFGAIGSIVPSTGNFRQKC
jgi:hypothetical protein